MAAAMRLMGLRTARKNPAFFGLEPAVGLFGRFRFFLWRSIKLPRRKKAALTKIRGIV